MKCCCEEGKGGGSTIWEVSPIRQIAIKTMEVEGIVCKEISEVVSIDGGCGVCFAFGVT